MKKSDSEILFEQNFSEVENRSKNFIVAPLDLNTTPSEDGLEDFQEVPTLKNNGFQGRHEGSESNGYNNVSNEVLELFLDLRRVMLDEPDKELLILRQTIPLEVDEEDLQGVEPTLLLDYIRQLFFQMARLKEEAQKDLIDAKENECSEYEPMLQKLEAEVREHIKIEQQLKLYCESIQEKLDDLQKTKGSSSQFEEGNINEQFEQLKTELKSINSKLENKDSDMENLRKDLKSKVDKIQALELQVDTIPILKAKIKELERIIQFNERNAAMHISSSTQIFGNKDSNFVALTNQTKENSNYEVARKKSQPFDPKALSAFENVMRAKAERQNSDRPHDLAESRKKEQMLKEKLYKVISPNQNEDVGRKSAVPNDHTHEKFKRTNSSMLRERPSFSSPEGANGDFSHTKTDRIHYINEDRLGSTSSNVQNHHKNVSEKLRSTISSSMSQKSARTSGSNKNINSTIEQDKNFQKLKRNNSQDQNLFDNFYRPKGGLTHRDILYAYGKNMETRPASSNKPSKNRSVTKGSIDIDHIKSLLHKENFQNKVKGEVSPGRGIDARSHSVDASSKNYRALRTKKSGEENIHVQNASAQNIEKSSQRPSSGRSDLKHMKENYAFEKLMKGLH